MNATVGRVFLDWRKAICESDLPSGTRHVMLVLSLYAPTIGEAAFPNLKTLSDACGLSPDVVRAHLRRGEKAGWIVREERFTAEGRQTSNAYLLSTPHGGGGPSEKSLPSPSRKIPGSKKKRGSSKKEERTCEKDFFEETLPAGKPDYTPAFEELWKVHPRGGKKPALAAYLRVLKKRRATHGELLDRLQSYVATFRGDFRGAALFRWLRDEQWHEKLDGCASEEDDFVSREAAKFRKLCEAES